MPKPVSMQAARPPTDKPQRAAGRRRCKSCSSCRNSAWTRESGGSGTPSRSGRLRRGDGDSVRWHDLRLEGENVAALGVDECLHPVHVVVVAPGLVWGAGLEGVVAEGLDAREVLDQASVRV